MTIEERLTALEESVRALADAIVSDQAHPGSWQASIRAAVARLRDVRKTNR